MFITDILKIKEISMTQKFNLIMKIITYIMSFHSRSVSIEDFEDTKMIIEKIAAKFYVAVCRCALPLRQSNGSSVVVGVVCSK